MNCDIRSYEIVFCAASGLDVEILGIFDGRPWRPYRIAEVKHRQVGRFYVHIPCDGIDDAATMIEVKRQIEHRLLH